MKFLNKRVPIGFVLVTIFVVATLVYSLGYKMAMDKFNSVVSYTQEKQKMYSTLSEVDYDVRKEYISNIDEANLLKSLCKGYVDGLNDKNCKFFSKQEYSDYTEANKNMTADVELIHMSEDTGYLRCRTLGNGASGIFTESVNTAISGGMSKLIIDLRDSELGKITETFKILQYLIPSGDIVSTLDKNNSKEVVCKSTSAGVNIKIAVLVNGKTSGASEIIAQALKDTGNAKIIGNNTAGKAAREKVINLSDDTVLVVPDAYYVTKSGDIVYKKGVTPDTISNLSDNLKALLEAKNLPYDQDTQLQDAIRQLNS
jgi:carboxyl-terminal processing protease